MRAATPSVVSALIAALTAAGVLCACGGSSAAPGTAAEERARAGEAAASSLAVSPLPGTPDASPNTQISFLGGAGTRVSAVRVVGSNSGPHRGVLRAYSTGTGESFIPSRPFLAGELVRVRARVRAGGAERRASTSFTIARRAAVSEAEFPVARGDPRAVQHYSSAPKLTPSSVRITTPAQPGAAPGDLFLAPYQGPGTPGPMIVDQEGQLVWFHPLPRGRQAANFGVQSYHGKPALVWWQGRIIEVGFGRGEDVVYDDSYRPIARVRAGNGYWADLHEIRLTPQDTAWIDALDPVHLDLGRVHGVRDGVLTDSIVQEIDVKTGLVMWEWHALGHIGLAASKNPVSRSSYPWDYAHLNSIDPGAHGDVLVSVRNTWTLYDIDLRTGRFRWRLGGSASSFKLGRGASFYWQHDARFQAGGLISVFDNGSDPPREKQSRGLLLRADEATRSVSLVRAFANPTHTLLSESQGNALSLPGGDWLLGYGRLPNFTEFDASGRVLLDGRLGPEVQSFKTLLSPWHGRPGQPPSLALSHSARGAVNVAVSWNGATEVAAWRLLAGPSPAALAPVRTSPKRGFEGRFAAPAGARYLAVQALDGSGAVLGVSASAKA
ncbi:MAG: hypothetical protein E6G34_14145 [Actinobacteria bacterium]|nr:MAG: hypothetical protein E6G34_14145 [Actinomycetota bacterium]